VKPLVVLPVPARIMSEPVSNPTNSCAPAKLPVTDAKLQDNLRRLDRLASLGVVAASAAHEIKNSLVAISAFAESLVEKCEDKEMATVVRQELKRINSLVTQMLRYATPKPVTLAPVAVHQVLDHSLRLLEHQMAGRQITLKREYHAEPGIVRGDEAQLQQVFMNLLLNAVEAIRGSGEVRVRTELAAENPDRRKVRVYITDSGMGIAAEHLSRVFEPFFTTKKNGTGLGLAVCQRVAQEHQGHIEVRSEPGRGSTFIVSLVTE
jgi:signal transduction histidine kinase